MNTCNKIESRSCRGCNVVSILWEKVQPTNREQIDAIAQQIGSQYCPSDSGGIDQPTIGTVYNYKVPDNK